MRTQFVCTDSVSDRNKMLLLKCPNIFAHLRLGLFVDTENHPRGPNAAPPAVPVPIESQAIWQRNYAEATQHLALFPSGREALRQEVAVLKALKDVVENGMTPEAQEHAKGALMALSDKEMVATGDTERQKHIMLSYQVRLGVLWVCLVCLVSPVFALQHCACFFDSRRLASFAVAQSADGAANPCFAMPPRLSRVDRHGNDEG